MTLPLTGPAAFTLSRSSEDVKMWLVLKLSTVVWTLAQSVLTVMTKGVTPMNALLKAAKGSHVFGSGWESLLPGTREWSGNETGTLLGRGSLKIWYYCFPFSCVNVCPGSCRAPRCLNTSSTENLHLPSWRRTTLRCRHTHSPPTCSHTQTHTHIHSQIHTPTVDLMQYHNYC